MHWICINGTHINSHRIDTFFWKDGKLWVWFSTPLEDPLTWDDPDQKLYVRMCNQLGVRPDEEETDGKG